MIGLKNIAAMLFSVIVLLGCGGCREFAAPDPSGFTHLDRPLVYSVGGSGEYAHSGNYLPSKDRYFYAVFDWANARIAQYASFQQPALIWYPFGVYSPFADAYYFCDIYTPRLAAIGAVDGVDRTAARYPVFAMQNIGRFCTKQGYLVMQSQQPEEAGYRVAIFNTTTGAFVRDDLFLRDWMINVSYDGEKTVYFGLSGQDAGAWNVTYALDLESFEVKEILRKQDQLASGLIACHDGQVFIARSMGLIDGKLDNSQGEIIRYDPLTSKAVSVPLPLPAADYACWMSFNYNGNFYLIVRQNWNYDDTPFGIAIFKYIPDTDEFVMVNDTALANVHFIGDPVVRDNKLIVSNVFAYRDESDKPKKFSQYRFVIVNLDTWEKEFDQIIWPY
jgi:hypothetical protein